MTILLLLITVDHSRRPQKSTIPMVIRSLSGEEAAAFIKKIDNSELDRFGRLGYTDSQRIPLRLAYREDRVASNGTESATDAVPTQNIIGGLSASTFGSYLFIRLLWVSEEIRGRGIGRALVTRAEEEARKRGCTNVLLSTFDFQAEPFYVKLGYTPFARIAGGLGNNATRVYLVKSLPSKCVVES